MRKDRILVESSENNGPVILIQLNDFSHLTPKT